MFERQFKADWSIRTFVSAREVARYAGRASAVGDEYSPQDLCSKAARKFCGDLLELFRRE